VLAFLSFDSGQDSAQNRVSIRRCFERDRPLHRQTTGRWGRAVDRCSSHGRRFIASKRSRKRTASTYDSEQDLLAESHHHGAGW